MQTTTKVGAVVGGGRGGGDFNTLYLCMWVCVFVVFDANEPHEQYIIRLQSRPLIYADSTSTRFFVEHTTINMLPTDFPSEWKRQILNVTIT